MNHARTPRSAPHRRRKPPGRPLVIDGKLWHWRPDRSGFALFTPTERRIYVTLEVFAGVDSMWLDEAVPDGYGPAMTPGAVVEYVRTHDMLGPDCSGSGEYVEPAQDPDTGVRRFTAEQLICPTCGHPGLHPVGWRRPKHKALHKEA